MKKLVYFTISLFCFTAQVNAQQLFPAYKDVEGDTVRVIQLNEVVKVSPMYFANDTARYQYNQYKYYVKSVLPYANKAVALFNNIDSVTKNMNNSERRKYVRSREKEIKTEFEDQLKKLNITQGRILVKLINKKANRTCFNIISYLHNPIKANSYQAWAKVNGMDLNEDYDPKKNPELERILKKLGN
jgi:hypothetical protein